MVQDDGPHRHPRPLRLRTDVPHDDAAVVLRAGTMDGATVCRAARRTFGVYAVLGISVEGILAGSVLDACRGERMIGYRQVRLSTFGRVRGSGFALLATFETPHFTLVLPDLDELTLARLDRCFDPPIPNPARNARW